MATPLDSVKQEVPSSALGADADLMAINRALNEWGACKHSRGTLRTHLVEVACVAARCQVCNRLMLANQCTFVHQLSPQVVRAALFHSIYGTLTFKRAPLLIDCAEHRQTMRALIGVEAEGLVFLFCAMNRRKFGDLRVFACPRFASSVNWPEEGLQITEEQQIALAHLFAINELEQSAHLSVTNPRLGSMFADCRGLSQLSCRLDRYRRFWTPPASQILAELELSCNVPKAPKPRPRKNPCALRCALPCKRCCGPRLPKRTARAFKLLVLLWAALIASTVLIMKLVASPFAWFSVGILLILHVALLAFSLRSVVSKSLKVIDANTGNTASVRISNYSSCDSVRLDLARQLRSAVFLSPRYLKREFSRSVRDDEIAGLALSGAGRL